MTADCETDPEAAVLKANTHKQEDSHILTEHITHELQSQHKSAPNNKHCYCAIVVKCQCRLASDGNPGCIIKARRPHLSITLFSALALRGHMCSEEIKNEADCVLYIAWDRGIVAVQAGRHK